MSYLEIFHTVSYLDTAHVGLPSETVHIQCTASPQNLDDSDTGQWTAVDRQRPSLTNQKKTNSKELILPLYILM